MAQNALNTDLPATASDVQMVCFRLFEEEFSVDITKVREIVRMPDITRIPRTPEYIRGIANLRGNVLPIIDCRQRFALPPEESTERTRVLVLDNNGSVTGLIVDAVSEVMQVSTDMIEIPPAATSSGVAGEYLSGVIKLDKGKRLVLMIRPEEIVTSKTSQTGTDRKTGGRGQSAVVEKQAARVIEEQQLVSFAVADEEYAFEISKVKEILRKSEITAVPNTAPEVKGLLTVRNALLPILDLRTILGLPELTRQDQQRILVVELETMAVGLLIDKVNEVLRVPCDVIDSADHLVAGSSELKAVARLDDGKRLIMILESRKLVDAGVISDLFHSKVKAGEIQEETKQREAEMGEEQVVTFMVGGEEYGISITRIQEINRLTEVTRLPRSPKFMAGITNLRGQVIPLVDLRIWFNMDNCEVCDRTRVIIIDLNGQRTGFIVDQVNEVLRIPAGNIETTPDLVAAGDGDERSSFLTGIGKIDNGRRMILLLDIKRLLSRSEQQTLARLGEKVIADSPKKTSAAKALPPKARTAAAGIPETTGARSGATSNKGKTTAKASPKAAVSKSRKMVIEE